MATCMHRLSTYRYLNVRYSFVLVVLHCNYYSYLTYLWPEIRKMISDNSSLHASSNTGYHSHSNGSWRNAPEVFLCTERPEETDWGGHCNCCLHKAYRQTCGVLEIPSCLIHDIFLKKALKYIKRAYFCRAMHNQHKYITLSEKYIHSDLQVYSLQLQAWALARVVVHKLCVRRSAVDGSSQIALWRQDCRIHRRAANTST